MSSDDASWEWAVAGIGEISAGEGLVGGVQAYHFTSRLAHYSAVYLLINVGLGFAPPWKQLKNAMDMLKKVKAIGAMSHASWSLIGDQPHTKFYTEGAFSADDLNESIGQTYAAGASVIAGYTLQAISASGLTSNYFRFVNVSGPSIGVDISASIKTGIWLRLYETEYAWPDGL